MSSLTDNNVMNTIETASQAVIARIKNEELKSVLKYIESECGGTVEIWSDGGDSNYSDVTVYSEYFSKKHLEVIFKHCFYGAEVMYAPSKKMMKIGMELDLCSLS